MWQQTHLIPRSHIASTIGGNRDYWVARTSKAVFGFADDSPAPLWTHPVGSYFSSYETVVCIGDSAIVPDYPNKKKGLTVLRAYNPADGEVRWEREKTHPAYGCGLLTDGERLLYSDLDADGGHYLMVTDPRSGEILHRIVIPEGYNIRAASLSQLGPRYHAFAGGQVYFRDRAEYTLYRASLDDTALSTVESVTGKPLMVDGDGRSIFVPVSEGKDTKDTPLRALLRLEPGSGEVLQRIPFPYVHDLDRMSVLSQPPHKGLIGLHLAADKGQGLMLVDFEQETYIHLGLPDEWYISQALYTPHGIIASIYKSIHGRDTDIIFIDPETHQLRYFPVPEKAQTNMQWNGKQLIVDCTSGWAIFEWVKGEEPVFQSRYTVFSVPEPVEEPADDGTIRQNLDQLSNDAEASDWQAILNTENLPRTGRPLGLSNIAQAGELLVVRDAYNIYAYHPDAKRMLWQIADESGGPVHLKVLEANEKIVVTAVWFGREERRFRLLGLEPATGKLLWQRRTWWSTWRSSNTRGGILLFDDYVFLREKNSLESKVNPRMVWLNALTGETVYECEDSLDLSDHWLCGGRLYGRERQALYHRSPAPGDDAFEKVFSTSHIYALRLTEQHIYVRYQSRDENDQKLDRIVCWDAATFTQQASMASPDYRNLEIFPADPQQPQRVLVRGKEHLHLFDLHSGEELWHLEQAGGFKNLRWTPQGIFFSQLEEELPDDSHPQPPGRIHWVLGTSIKKPKISHARAYLIGEATGSIGPAPFAKANAIVLLGDYVAAQGGVGMQVYVRAEQEMPQTPAEWPVYSSRALVLEPDIPPDPRDELQQLMREAGQDGPLEPVYAKICEMFCVAKLPKKVKDYFTALRRGELERGPLRFVAWDDLAQHCMQYRFMVFKFHPGERFFPAFLIAYDEDDNEFWMLADSGKIIDLSRGLLYGALDKLWDAYRLNVPAFEKKLASRGTGRNVQQLMKFQQTFAAVGQMRDLENLEPEDTFRKIAACFNWKLPGLFDKMEDCRYFRGLVNTHKKLLKALSVKETAPDPRPELQRLISEAGSDKPLQAVYAHLCRMFAIKAVAPPVQDFFETLRRGELADGPLDFTPWEKLPAACHYYRDLFKFKLQDRFFPAFTIAGEDGGVEFWLMAATGTVIDLHHDASFFEAADEVWESRRPDVAAFEKAFPRRGNELNISQLMRLQQAFPEVKRMSDLVDRDPQDTFRKIAEAFGWSLVDLGAWLGEIDYFFLLYDTHKAVLEGMGEKGIG